MSATNDYLKRPEAHQNKKIPLYQANPSYTVRVICCVLFIFLTEMCLAHYIYRLIRAEISSQYIEKTTLGQILLVELQSDKIREEIRRILGENELDEPITKWNNNENKGIDGKSFVPDKIKEKKPLPSRDVNVKDGGKIDHNENKRSKREALVEDNLLNSSGKHFNPLRDPKDEMERLQKNKKPGDTELPRPWIELTSQSRIPIPVILDFCARAIKDCPPGNPGPKGSAGAKGVKGDRGDTGLPGIPGPIGPRGYSGLPGEKGESGRPGLDGRDGIPGEPGLDGMPGRNGHDGQTGKDGIPGTPGRDGRNGTDGRPGSVGPRGLPGPQGPPGMPGPKGPPGKKGIDGTPGIPGVKAWEMKVNGSSKLLIPPSIASSSLPNSPVVFFEGENVKMHCTASGIPTPHVEWKRQDKQPIAMGRWQVTSIEGSTLNITQVNRVHMGVYRCIADNGVPPQAVHSVTIEVHFPPLIRIKNQRIEVTNGSTAVLECEVEAFPEAVRYWERVDGKLLEHGGKYRIATYSDKNGYRATMQLNITRITPYDVSKYLCIAKNERGLTRGSFTLYERDLRLGTPPPIIGNNDMIVIGMPSPPLTSLEELCPPPPKCEECVDPKELKCKEFGVSLFDLIRRWEVRPYGEERYTGLPNRTLDCLLYAVGKPVYHRFTDENFGSWMKDPSPLNEYDGEKFWTTKENDWTKLYQYDNKNVFRKDNPSRKINLLHPFQGNSHVVFNGSFFYNEMNTSTIIKLDLERETTSSVTIPSAKANTNYLYSSGHNYMDFSVDDNGLWVIFPVPDSNNTGVLKWDVNTLKIEYIWNISLNHHRVGEMFVACGVLYALDSVVDRTSTIRFALDLYTNNLIDINLSFTNPFRKTTMLTYNHRSKELYTWDKGNQLTYPVRYHDLGYNYTKIEDKNKKVVENVNV